MTLSRDNWKQACQFRTFSDREVLNETLRQTRETRAKGKAALILLDLDSTLYEVGPRTETILREWREHSLSESFPGLRSLLSSLHIGHVGYSLKDTFKALGQDLEAEELKAALPHAKTFWEDRFFTSHYLKEDRVYPGAVEFALELHREGAELVYLTGRDEPRMGEGTRSRLIQDGFPLGVERTRLILKPEPQLDDLTHKQIAVEVVRNEGELVASFENEPPNVVAIYDLYPQAMHVFVDTVCSDRPAEVRPGLFRLKSFQ